MQWLAMLLAFLLMGVPARAAQSPQWVLDPLVPGPDLPSAGASLFDQLTMDVDGRSQIPFPFERLIARVEAAAGCSAAQPCTRAVLIPLGRSLQRVAASPDFFKHPRAVVAVTGEGTGQLLRDRIYLGFQDKANVLEVISYNETLGRFEFQIVKNYAAGRTPEVRYARRTVCLACHQNQGPIFSQAVWLETNANPQVATRLVEQQSSFSGIAARGNTDIAQAIDDATDRANRIALTQRLWMDGCNADCRRAGLLASLQYALNGQRSYIQKSHAGSHWPAGLALASADIANRDALDLHPGVTALRAAHIEPRFDPLAPRVPEQIAAPSFGEHLVRGIADFWPARGRAALANVLERRGGSKLHRATLPCRISGATGLEQFECAAGNSRLRGALNGDTGSIDEIAVDTAESVRHLRVDSASRQGGEVMLRVRDGPRRARLADGNALERIVLDRKGSALVEVRHDFDALVETVSRMELPQQPLASSLLEAVTAQLEGRAAASVPQRQARATADVYSPVAVSANALQFESQCGVCHRTADITPPNFLSGSAQRVAAALASCAPRIFVRLAMNDAPSAHRMKTPMPPELPSLTAQPRKPRAADERARVELQAAVGAVLRREYGHDVTLDELLRHGYESLRPCLPVAAEETRHVRTDS